MPIEDSSRVRGSGAMRTAVVTGGTRGIGLGMAKALAGRGYSLALTYSSDQKAAGVAEGKSGAAFNRKVGLWSSKETLRIRE